MVSKKFEKDFFLLSFESVVDSCVLDSSALFHVHLIEVISLIMSKGILGFLIWGIMNTIRLLEREKLRLSCRMVIIGYYMRYDMFQG